MQKKATKVKSHIKYKKVQNDIPKRPDRHLTEEIKLVIFYFKLNYITKKIQAMKKITYIRNRNAQKKKRNRNAQ